jgi:hypothetical protein
MRLKKYLVGLQFSDKWLQIGVYATDQQKAGDTAVREFKCERPPFCTSIIGVDEYSKDNR